MARKGWMATAGLGAVLATALAACDKAPTAKSPPGKASPPAQVATATQPRRKAGLWVQTTHYGTIEQVTRLCLDPASDEALGFAGARTGKRPCRRTLTPSPAGGWTFVSACDMGEAGTLTAHGVASGDFTTRYRVEVEVETTGAAAPQMNGLRRFITEAVWQGPCPAGMQPGDVELPNGLRFNPAQGTGG